jgi:hypothetical protein
MNFKLLNLILLWSLFSCSDVPTENVVFKQNPVNLLEILSAKTFGSTKLNGKSFVQTSSGVNQKTIVTIYFNEWFNLREFSSIEFNPIFYTIADSTVFSNDLEYDLKVSEVSVSELSKISLFDLKNKYLGVDADFKFGVEFRLYSGSRSIGAGPSLPASTEFHITDIQLLATLK